MGLWLRRHLLVTAGGAIALIVVAGGLTVAAESATVHVTVPPQRIETVVNLNTVSVQHIQAKLTDTWPGTASTVQVAAAYATGTVRFNLVCAVYPPCQPLTVPVGTIVGTTHGIHYATQTSITLQAPAATQRVTVAIRAVAPGPAANQSAGAIQVIVTNPRPCCLTALNVDPTTGGADAGPAAVVQQSDLDAAKAALQTKMTNELLATLTASAAGMTFVQDGPPSITVTADHNVGDKSATFTLSGTGVFGAFAFANTAAQATLRDALQRAVLPGYRLKDPIQETFAFTPGTKPGQESVWGHALGFAVPSTSGSSLASRLTGVGVADAISRLHRDFPGSKVTVRTGPLPMRWLPLFANRITVEITAGPVPKL